MQDAVREAIHHSLGEEARSLAELAARIDLEPMVQAIEAISRAQLVVTCASGSSGIAAAKFAHTLCCVEQPAKFMPPSEAIHGGLGCVQSRDVVVMVSRGGRTAELLPIIDVVLDRGAFLIAVTENLESRLAQAASLVLPMHVGSESDPLGLMATSSFVVTLGIFDALIAGLIRATGYTREQFALIHPGGAVGATLNQGVSPSA